MSTLPGNNEKSMPVLVIGGMHRSGTSLTASLLSAAGLHVGDRILGCDPNNPDPSNSKGHFEDIEFLLFHERVLAANGLVSEGLVAEGNPRVPPSLRDEALQMIVSRTARQRPWGWKEPRTILFLDFWESLLPNGKYLFVFRKPWEVVDSLFRRGNKIFVTHPELAIGVWLNYNRRILEFVKKYPDKCLLSELSQIVQSPNEVFAAMRSTFGLQIDDPPLCYDKTLLIEERGPYQPAIVRAACPEAYDLYLEMRDRAGSQSALSPCSSPDADRFMLSQAATLQWSLSTTLKRQLAIADQQVIDMRQEVIGAASQAATLADRVAASQAELAIADQQVIDMRQEAIGAASQVATLADRVAASQAELARLQAEYCQPRKTISQRIAREIQRVGEQFRGLLKTIRTALNHG